jgi:transposase
MLTKMTEEDWVLVLEVFDACRSRRGDKGRDDRKFLEALHYFTVHNITWRALPAEFGSWNSIWKRFWRLSRSGVFETFFEALASLSERAHLVQMFDSTVIRAHVSAAGAKGGRMAKHSGASRSSHDACGCSTQTTSTINLKRSTLHPHEGQAVFKPEREKIGWVRAERDEF